MVGWKDGEDESQKWMKEKGERETNHDIGCKCDFFVLIEESRAPVSVLGRHL